MSFVRKEDAAKAGKLIGAIIAVFGCAAWRVVGAVAPARPASAAAPTEAAPVVVNASPSPSTPAKTPEGEIELPTLLASANANPFRPFPAVPVVPQEPKVSPPSSMTGALTPLPPTTGEPLPSPHPATATVAEKPVLASFRLSGILAGPHATAVLDYGEDSTVVYVGSLLSDGSTVMRIDDASVTLSRAGKKVVLTVAD